MSVPKRGSPDFILLILTLLLVGFGIVMVFSASSATSATKLNDALYYTKRQVMWAALGSIGLIVLMNTHYSKFKKWFVPFFMLTTFLLVLVLIIGKEVNGAKSWFYIGPFGGQPTELAKLSVIIYLSALISRKGEKFRDFKKGLLPVLIVVGFVSMLVMMQPDLGSCIVLLMCAGIVAIVGGANMKHILMLGLVGVLAGLMMLSGYMLSGDDGATSYRVERFTSFQDPWADPLGAGFHLIQSLFAFGHGGLTGAGFGQSIQKLHYLPESHNDFIFAIIGEEFGFIGTLIFILIYLFFLWRGLMVSLRSPDLFGTLVGTGIVGMISIQALINIGGVTGSIPITGVTLPFISSGGSSLLVCMMSMGILLSISRETKASPVSNKRNIAA